MSPATPSPAGSWPTVAAVGWGLALGLLIGVASHPGPSTYLLGVGVIAVLVIGYFVRFLPGASTAVGFLIALFVGVLATVH